jgi:uncharacterized protein
MEQRISLVTLGVADLERARAFYQRLGWEGQEVEETVFIQAGGIALVLWGREKLALDCGIADDQTTGFSGVVLAHNVRSEEEVDDVMASAENAGATVTRPAASGQDVLRRLRGLLHRSRRPRLGDRAQSWLPTGIGWLDHHPRLQHVIAPTPGRWAGFPLR